MTKEFGKVKKAYEDMSTHVHGIRDNRSSLVHDHKVLKREVAMKFNHLNQIIETQPLTQDGLSFKINQQSKKLKALQSKEIEVNHASRH